MYCVNKGERYVILRGRDTIQKAADLYIHSARADTFPTTILEALACGIPSRS